MTELDRQTKRAIVDLRANLGPPADRVDPLLAALHARLEGPGGGGEAAGDQGAGDQGAGDQGAGQVGASSSKLAGFAHAAKVIALTAALTTVGLGGVWVVGGIWRSGPGSERPVGAAQAPGREFEVANSPLDPAGETEMPRELSTEGETEGETDELRGGAEQPFAVEVRSEQDSRSVSQPTLGEELALLRAAKRESGAEALSILKEHARRFPNGTLAAEREGLWTLALCELGRVEAAQIRATRLAQSHPRALIVQRLRVECPELELPTTDPRVAGDDSE